MLWRRQIRVDQTDGFKPIPRPSHKNFLTVRLFSLWPSYFPPSPYSSQKLALLMMPARVVQQGSVGTSLMGASLFSNCQLAPDAAG